MAIIKVNNLSKTFRVKLKEKGLKGSFKSIFKPKYKVIKAVKNINFEVEKGEMIAFIGPNGAGKSTTIKMLTGILYPDKGDISVLDIDPKKERKKLAYNIGTVFGQKEQLWTHLTPYDNFKFFGAIYDIPDSRVDRTMEPNENRVPADTYFLVRESDERIIGMINIRHCLNENLRLIGGHIGYSVRPTERRKGYNKINLYLGLLRCQELGIDEVLMDCDADNLGSARTMQALGGRLVREWYEPNIYKTVLRDYVIDVDESIKTYRKVYEPMTYR